jgi:predicted transcriptional regulator YheO
LGANYEIVLHDYRIPDRSVVAVAGRVTERQVGRHDNLTLARAIYRGRVSQIFL